jgi:hypothetical protein
MKGIKLNLTVPQNYKNTLFWKSAHFSLQLYHKWLQHVVVEAMIYFKFRLQEKKKSLKMTKDHFVKFSLNFLS